MSDYYLYISVDANSTKNYVNEVQIDWPKQHLKEQTMDKNAESENGKGLETCSEVKSDCYSFRRPRVRSQNTHGDKIV